MTKVFIDMHHEQLFRSLQLLFEKRLGYEVYRPIGEEWFTRGFWTNAEIYNNHPDTIAQFLAVRDVKPTKMGHRNLVIDRNAKFYTVQANPIQKAMTFEQFCNADIDIVIASYYSNIEPYQRLINEYKPAAKLIVQMGNNWPVDWQIVKNLMSSTLPIPVPKDRNAVFYHQEFDLTIYSPDLIDRPRNKMMSFVHCMMEHEMHKQDWQDFQDLEQALPEYDFTSYGISCRDGKIYEQTQIAEMMRDCYFGIHFKEHGDGYGHVIHNWFASATPLIYKGGQYKGTLAESLLIDGKTGFDYARGNAVERIKKLSADDYVAMRQQTHQRFTEVVNFDQEEKEVRKFIERLI